MFIRRNTKTVGTKTYQSILLVEGYRTKGRVRHRTLANLTQWPKHVTQAMEAALKGQELTSCSEIETRAGKKCGGLFALYELSRELCIEKVLGKTREAKLALLLVFGRILTQGSRRHLTFWQKGQALQEVLGIDPFTTDDLYRTLDWIDSHQEGFERQLFKERYGKRKVKLFLYDITSSYFEGVKNELAEYGYNRDGKKGKKQIVVGLLTDGEGYPVAVEVFKGNTTDSVTVPDQIAKLAARFDAGEVIFVGDGGMIKKTGITAIEKKEDWHYITTITKPQIRKLLKTKVLQMELFDEDLCEVEQGDFRYILRRNPQRQKEIEENRTDRIQKILQLQEALNEDLANKPRKREAVALKKLREKIRQYKLQKILTAESDNRTLSVDENAEALKETSKLDGCYVMKTDIKKNALDMEYIHASYKNLKFVEWAFRMMKTGLLELRPLFHRKANRTRALAFVAMLAYMIIYHLWKKCKHLEVPLEEIIASIEDIQTTEIRVSDYWVPKVPTTLREDQQSYFDTLELDLPKSFGGNLRPVVTNN